MAQGVVFIDLSGRIALLNEKAKELLKTTEAEGKLFHDLFPDEYFGFSIKESLSQGLSYHLFYRSIHQKEVEITTAFDQGLLILLKDRSEIHKHQVLAQRAERMKELGEMAAHIAHNIRNPLGAVRGCASLLYKDLSHERQLQDMAGIIVDGTKSLEALTLNLLHYARPLELAIQSTDLSRHLRVIGKLITKDPSYSSKISIELNVPKKPFFAPVDPERLQGALWHVIVNAFQAMPKGGVLQISLEEAEETAKISIADTGEGMKEEMLKQIFSPLFTTKKGGNGLGLAETKKIVQAHFGTIDVTSAIGKGTTFTLSLPLRRL